MYNVKHISLNFDNNTAIITTDKNRLYFTQDINNNVNIKWIPYGDQMN